MNGEYLLDHKIFIDLAKLPPYRLLPMYNFAEKLCYEDYIRRGILVRDEDETEDRLYQEAVAVRNKTIFVNNLPCPTLIQDLIDLFKDVGKVVHVRLVIDCEGNQIGDGYVEFSSEEEAEQALKKEYLPDQEIFLCSAEGFLDPKYCIDHKVWYENYLRQESLLIGADETPDFAEENAVRRKTLFVANLSHHNNELQISNISKIFKDVVQVVRVRLIVDHCGEHVNCGFVEFASSNEAQKALRHRKRRCKLIFYEAEIAATYPFRHKYNFEQKLWYEDKLRREYLKTAPNLKIAFTDE